MAASYNNVHLSTSQEDYVQLTGNTGGFVNNLQSRWRQLTRQQILVGVCVALAILNFALIIHICSRSDPNPPSSLSLQGAGNEAGYFRRFLYPSVRRDEDVSDTFHGVEVKDPYRWLEGNSSDVAKFVENQNKLTDEFLAPSRKGRNGFWRRLKAQIENVWESPWHQMPTKVGNKYFTFFRVAMNVTEENIWEPYHRFYAVRTTLNGSDEVYLDELKEGIQPKNNILDIDHTSSGDLIAYTYRSKEAKSNNGATENTIKFRNVTSKLDLQETIVTSFSDLYGSMRFTADDKGIFYMNETWSTEEDSTRTVKFTVFHHVLGRSQSDDTILGEILMKNYTSSGVSIQYTKSNDFLIATATTPAYYLLSLTKKSNALQLTMPNPHAWYSYIDNEDLNFLFIRSGESIPRKVVKLDFRTAFPLKDGDSPRVPVETDFIKPSADDTTYVIHAAVIDENKLLLVYQNYSQPILELRNLASGALIQTWTNFELGFISRLSEDRNEKEFFLYHQSLISATTFHCSVVKDTQLECKTFNQTQIPGIDTSNFVHEQIFYTVPEGKSLPLNILRRKDVPLDGKSPLLLQTGSITSATRNGLIFGDNFNGIYAYIQPKEVTWRYNKTRTFAHSHFVEEMEAAARYLIANNYTRPDKMGIVGGWFAAACVNLHPDLYGAVIVRRAIHDLIRQSVGCGACDQFGTPEEPDNFEQLLKYSPLQNIRLPENGKQYPGIFVLSRSFRGYWQSPASAYKYVAHLQYELGRSPNQTNPLLIDVDTRSSIPYPNVKETTDTFAFLAEALDMEFKSC